jgi:hypothetical protein
MANATKPVADAPLAEAIGILTSPDAISAEVDGAFASAILAF